MRTAIAALLLIVALGIRIAFIETEPYRPINDAGSYNRLAGMVARTGDYAVGNGRHAGAGGARGPTAYFPPGYPYFLAAVDLIDGHTDGHHDAIAEERTAQVLLGTVTVGLLGLVALEALGADAALIAMGLGAVYPVLIEVSGTLVAENLLTPLALAATWTALRARRAERRPYAWVAATGLLTGLATLTHQNAILLLIPFGLMAVGVGLRRSRRSGPRGSPSLLQAPGRRPRPGPVSARLPVLAAPLLLLAVTAAMIAPWTVRNAIVMHRFLPVSDETGLTLRGTYNPESAAFAPVPYKWRLYIGITQDHWLWHHAGRYTEAQLSDELTSRALSYIAQHPTAPLQVAYHNTLRMLELEGTFAWQASAEAIGLRVGAARIGVIGFWILALLALAGIPTRAARSLPRWIWLIPVLYALSIVFVNVETPRFREPIDPYVVLLATCALTTVLERRLGRAPARRRSGLGGAPVRGRGRTAGVPG